VMELGAIQTFSQQGTGCISCRLAASVVAALTPILRLVAIIKQGYVSDLRRKGLLDILWALGELRRIQCLS